jgi:penicillin-binding protein 2
MSARENNRHKLLTRRAALLAGGQAVLAGALAARMYQLQILERDKYAVLAEENRINVRLLAPPRGRILDRFGVPLADNRLNYRVVVVPEQAGNLEGTLAAIAKLIEVSEADQRRVMRDVQRKHAFVPLVVRANLTWEEMARIEVAMPELPGVAIEQGLIRDYPYGTSASHVLGYVAAVSEKELTGDPLLELPDFRIGKNGVEKAQDLQLRGGAGTSQVEVNAFGRVVREIATTPGQPGRDIVLGLDAALQEFAVKRCSVEQSLSCVVLDALTGDVLAMVSSPSFDPTQFSTGLTPALWQELSTDPRNPLTDKVIAGVYPPGSTFKPVVALAALEAGAMTPDTSVGCPGYFSLGNATFHCWRKEGHGAMRLHDGIKKSCDVYFYETARRVGIDRIAAMARKLGFGTPVGLDIPGERGGTIPDRERQLALSGVAWQPGETLIAGIGQGSVTATPIQLATMVARLVTGRAVVPRLFRQEGRLVPASEIKSPFPELGINPRWLALVLDGMNAVVNEQGGTAYASRITDPAMAMGGKSGTSQVRRISAAEREHGVRKGTAVPWKERDHALFVSFAPVSAPRYVCAVVVEHGGETGGGGSAVAAPICRDVLMETQKRDPARRLPQPAIAEISSAIPLVPPTRTDPRRG